MQRAQAVTIFHIHLLRLHHENRLPLDDRDVAALSDALKAIAAAAEREGGDMERASPLVKGPAPFGS